MVQGLAFLTKKSWHTKNLANQEKVWIAEQKEKAEVAKTAELAKQIQQEREEEELQKIAGTSDKKLDRGIAWLYDGHRKDSETAKADAEKQAEEYLLGKAYEPQQKMIGDLESAVDGHEGVNAVVASVDAALPAEDSVANRNEAFRVRHEDPMYEVARQKVRQERALEHKKELYMKAGYAVKTKHEESDGDDEGEQDKKKRKKAKKRKGEKKKRKKKSHRYYSSDSSEEEPRDVSREHHRKRRRRSFSRSLSSDSVDKRRSSNSLRRRSRSPRRQRSRSRSPPRYRSDHRYDSREYERSRQMSRHERDRDHERSRRREYGVNGVFDDSVCRHHNEDVRDEFGRVKIHQKGSKTEAEKPYGLQGGHGRPKSASDLGPDRDLLERKRQERDAERHRRVTSKQRRPISRAERQAAVEAMQRDAATRASCRDTSRGDYTEDDDNGKPEASFLKQVTAQAHGIEGDHHSLSDRLHQNRHRNQRHTDEFL